MDRVSSRSRRALSFGFRDCIRSVNMKVWLTRKYAERIARRRPERSTHRGQNRPPAN